MHLPMPFLRALQAHLQAGCVQAGEHVEAEQAGQEAQRQRAPSNRLRNINTRVTGLSYLGAAAMGAVCRDHGRRVVVPAAHQSALGKACYAASAYHLSCTHKPVANSGQCYFMA
jgi:hypothetical protein